MTKEVDKIEHDIEHDQQLTLDQTESNTSQDYNVKTRRCNNDSAKLHVGMTIAFGRVLGEHCRDHIPVIYFQGLRTRTND